MSAFADTIFSSSRKRGGPAPRRLRVVLSEDAVARHRAFDCSGYEGCLALAAVENWTSWSCAGCPVGGLRPAPIPTPPVRDPSEPRTSAVPRRTRVAALLQASSGPMHATEIAEHLGVDPLGITTDLSLLTRQGDIVRVGPGTYSKPSAPPPPKDALPPRPPGLESRVLEVIQRSEKAQTGPQIAEAIREAQVPRVANALVKLAQQGKIRRVGRGFYGRVTP